MKLGIFGGISGLVIGAIILWFFVHFTATDSPWRILGFVLALAAFIGCVVLAMKGEKRSLNDKAPR